MELPQYTLKPDSNRMVVPWILKLLGLCALFYVGIWINVKLLLKMTIPGIVNILIVIILIALVVVQIILYHVRFNKFKYVFFTNRVEYEGVKPQTFLFSDYQSSELKQNFLDKFFGTGTIVLQPGMSIGPIANAKQIYSYFQQLLKYFQTTRAKYTSFKPFHEAKPAQAVSNSPSALGSQPRQPDQSAHEPQQSPQQQFQSTQQTRPDTQQ